MTDLNRTQNQPFTLSTEDAENRLYAGIQLSRSELLLLAESNVEQLAATANRIRDHFCGKTVEFCAIVNAKNGRCSENCKYCAQSRFYQVSII